MNEVTTLLSFKRVHFVDDFDYSETLRKKLENNKDVCVVDIRSEEDYEEEHISGSEDRPIREVLLSGDVEEALAALDDLPSDEGLVMVCDAGVASTETARQLQGQGEDAKALEDRLDAWKQIKSSRVDHRLQDNSEVHTETTLQDGLSRGADSPKEGTQPTNYGRESPQF
ncbi:rhodanese-like domain-containing protein [Haloarcula sp. Atlit-7R]|uniref:rhodanese-like domain-containing protein n=1 Tax=Haloarcula sp. Atlit-7R TaxID=2282125 RepID=UPI00131422E9|nr:rhodanese-like domain-containing protein [Haloarcula sp. Atlit-7R]